MNSGHPIARDSGLIGSRRRKREIALLADELNQFAMAVEEYTERNMLSAEARLATKEFARDRLLFNAARRLRERITGLIPE